MIAIVSERQIAEILRKLREYHDLGHADVARIVHADRRTVEGRETGHQGYTLHALIDTARIYGLRLALVAVEEPQLGDAAALTDRRTA